MLHHWQESNAGNSEQLGRPACDSVRLNRAESVSHIGNWYHSIIDGMMECEACQDKIRRYNMPSARKTNLKTDISEGDDAQEKNRAPMVNSQDRLLYLVTSANNSTVL